MGYVYLLLETDKNGDETLKRKLSDSHLKWSNKECGQFGLDGKLIKIWDRVIDASHHFNSSHILSVCQNKRKTACGFIWSFDTNKCEIFKIKK